MGSTLQPSAQYAVTLRLDCPHAPGWIARITSAIAAAGGSIGAIDLVHITRGRSLRDYTVESGSPQQARDVIEAVKGIEGVTVHSVQDRTFALHRGGKLATVSRVSLETHADLSMAYTPGVARVCSAIQDNPKTAFNLTIRKNCVAVISDGSAVLGLGNIGPAAALPVMEGKAILFKEFGGVDAFPLCLDTQDTEEIIRICKAVAPTFGGINLEDIAAPKCFTIEERLKEALDIPVFHDDQHGTAVVVLAATINALKLTGKDREKMKLVVAGAGAAGYACIRTLQAFGMGTIVACDREGAIHAGRDVGDNPVKAWLKEHTNPHGETGSLQEVLAGADMFLGVSAPRLLDGSDLKTMADQPIVFAMSNPTPEVSPEAAAGIVAVMATGRSDYPNQINNVLAFPGIFRGALDAHAREINGEMTQAAAHAIAAMVPAEDLSADYIVPSVLNRKVGREVAAAVSRAAHASGVARRMPLATRLYLRP